MKKFFSIFVLAIVLLSLSSYCLAAPEDVDTSSEAVQQTEDLSMDVIINDSVSGQKVIDTLIEALADKSVTDDVTGEELQLTGVSIKSIAPVTPSSTSGLKAALLGVIGNYDPVIVEYQYQSGSSGYYSYMREIQPDYVWLCSCAILVVVIFCLFKLGGAALSKR